MMEVVMKLANMKENIGYMMKKWHIQLKRMDSH